jgi:hypothetical protein
MTEISKDLEDKLKAFERLTGEKLELTPEDKKIGEFFNLFHKASSKDEEDCGDPENDCSDYVSKCCSAILTTIFGTLPLEVKCSKCEKVYLLHELIKNDK